MQPDRSRLLLLVIRSARPMFAEVPWADLSFATGRVVVLTTTKEHAELKRDQIHAFGADRLLTHLKGLITASIEAEERE